VGELLEAVRSRYFDFKELDGSTVRESRINRIYRTVLAMTLKSGGRFNGWDENADRALQEALAQAETNLQQGTSGQSSPRALLLRVEEALRQRYGEIPVDHDPGSLVGRNRFNNLTALIRVLSHEFPEAPSSQATVSDDAVNALEAVSEISENVFSVNEELLDVWFLQAWHNLGSRSI